jgi:hypothetical protein
MEASVMFEETRKCGIYSITEIETGRKYIGQTRATFEYRWKQHHKRFPTDKYTYEVIEMCEPHQLDELERYYIEKFGSRYPDGFNMSKGGNNTWSRVWTDAQKETVAAHQSQAMKKRWQDEEYRRIYTENSKIVSRKIWSDSGHRDKVSSSVRETWSDPELRERHSENMKKKLKDPEMRKLWSEKSKKLWESEEYRQKVSEATARGWSDPDKRAARRLQQKGIPKEQVECPYCGKKGGRPTMTRWHFDNCKAKK